MSKGTQNRHEHTVCVGMQNLCCCKSWHYEHHSLMTFRRGLTWRIQSHRLQTKHFRKATLFSYEALPSLWHLVWKSQAEAPAFPLQHCSPLSLWQHLGINTLPTPPLYQPIYGWVPSSSGGLHTPSLMLHCNKSSSAPKHTFDFKARVIRWWHTYVRLGIHVSIRANRRALYSASSPPGAGTAWICMQEGEHVLYKCIYRRWAQAGT